jgi:hypothetical protein
VQTVFTVIGTMGCPRVEDTRQQRSPPTLFKVSALGRPAGRDKQESAKRDHICSSRFLNVRIMMISLADEFAVPRTRTEEHSTNVPTEAASVETWTDVIVRFPKTLS